MTSAASTEARVKVKRRTRRGSQLAERDSVSAAPKFIADAMLGSLARKLRIYGFDTLYFRDGSDSTLENVARLEGRVILTADERFCSEALRDGLRAIRVEGRTDTARLLSVLRQAGPRSVLQFAKPDLSRCAVCNGRLEIIAKRRAARLNIPPKVLSRHRLFYRCRSCSRLYWRGRHWERLRRLSRSVKTKALT